MTKYSKKERKKYILIFYIMINRISKIYVKTAAYRIPINLLNSSINTKQFQGTQQQEIY